MGKVEIHILMYFLDVKFYCFCVLLLFFQKEYYYKRKCYKSGKWVLLPNKCSRNINLITV